MSDLHDADIASHSFECQNRTSTGNELSDDELKRLLNIIPKCFPQEDTIFSNLSVTFKVKPNERSFWSKIVCASLTWRDEVLAKKYPASLFMKIPKVSQNVKNANILDDDNDDDDVLFDLTKHEVLWYKKYNNEVIADFPTPTFYAAEDITDYGSGIIAIEDLTEKAFSMDYIPGFQLEQVELLMETLASFHYHFITMEDKSWVEEFNRTATINEKSQMLQFKCAKKFEILNPILFGKVEALYDIFSVEEAIKAHYSYRDLGIPPVMVHFDLNTTNVLWRKSSNSRSKLLAVIDFQLLHSGNLAEDIARILMLGISKDDRRQYTDKFLKRYYDSLSGKFDGFPPFSFEKVKEAYDQIFLYACNFVLFGLSCYYEMYDDFDLNSMKFKQDELISRATGLIEEALERKKAF